MLSNSSKCLRHKSNSVRQYLFRLHMLVSDMSGCSLTILYKTFQGVNIVLIVLFTCHDQFEVIYSKTGIHFMVVQ